MITNQCFRIKLFDGVTIEKRGREAWLLIDQKVLSCNTELTHDDLIKLAKRVATWDESAESCLCVANDTNNFTFSQFY